MGSPLLADPRRVSRMTFMASTADRNLRLISKLSASVEGCISEDIRRSTVFGVPGSDGRLERGFVSTAEIIVISKDSDSLSDAVRALEGIGYGPQHVEPKHLIHHKMSNFHNRPDAVYPQRLYDCTVIAGNLVYLSRL